MTDSISILSIDKAHLSIVVDMSLYSKEAMLSAMYSFTDRFYIHQETLDDNHTKVNVIFEQKEGNFKIDELVLKEFSNKLIDSQVRENINSRFGSIRDKIVEEAFKPVNK